MLVRYLPHEPTFVRGWTRQEPDDEEEEEFEDENEEGEEDEDFMRE
jgi:hypothetical protein